MDSVERHQHGFEAVMIALVAGLAICLHTIAISTVY